MGTAVDKVGFAVFVRICYVPIVTIADVFHKTGIFIQPRGCNGASRVNTIL